MKIDQPGCTAPFLSTPFLRGWEDDMAACADGLLLAKWAGADSSRVTSMNDVLTKDPQK